MKTRNARNDRSGSVAIALAPKEMQLPEAFFGRAAEAPDMFRLKKILVPLDFSECSKKALAYAVCFARQFGAELALLHVVQPYPFVPEMPRVDMETLEEAREELKLLRLTLGDAAKTTSLLRTGTPHSEIVRVAKELLADLIIIGTHGHTGLARVLLGSTAERVVRHATCPVLVVREKETEFLAGEPKEDYEDEK